MTVESSKHKLLIVDDIAENISVLFEFLSKMGFKVLVAQDGKSAIQRADFTGCDDAWD
jgi:CheY-like chemotaxis protein